MRFITKALIEVYKRIDKHQRLFPHGIEKLIEVNIIKLYVNKLDSGGMAYENQYEETVNVLYRLIADECKPKVVLDIGANYGFISLVIAQYLPYAWYVAIEPNKKLIPYLEKNLKELNGTVINAICGDKYGVHDFYINYLNSQDCRVIGLPEWEMQPVNEITIDSLIEYLDEFVFIKIDVQGYEERVIRGGKKFFDLNNNWIMKMEFAPTWLEFHGTDYRKFLQMLVDKYDVAELTVLSFNIKSLDDIFRHKITDIEPFLNHIMKLKKNNTGWRDLLIRPKK
jgi:FkbM family methyltransferase